LVFPPSNSSNNSSNLLFAEDTLTITTYYPSPYGVYRELRAKRIAIGDDYIQGGTYDWESTDGDGGEIDYAADLVVEGNVGIGTVNPGALLHILGANPGGVDMITGLKLDRVYDSVGDQMNLDFGDGSTNGAGRIAVLATGGGESAFTFSAQTSSGVAYTNEIMRIQGNGRVGIGTTAPPEKLTLKSGALAIANGGDGTFGDAIYFDYIWDAAHTYSHKIKFSNSYGSTSLNKIVFSMYPGGAPSFVDVLTLEGSGNVGIGTVSPYGILHLRQSSGVDLLIKGGCAVSGAVSINAVNDTDSANIPLEIRSSKTYFTSGTVDLGREIILTGGDNISVIKGGAPNTSTAGFISIQARDGDEMFRFWTDSATAYQNSAEGGGWGSQAFDYAELIEYDNKEKIEAGDVIVSIGKKGDRDYADKSGYPYQETIIGVVSTKPGFIGGVPWEDKPVSPPDIDKALSLAGRVPVKVCTENGSIKVGDYLTSSSIPGVAMKASKPGQTVGKAMEEYREKDPKKIGKITIFVNPVWFGADLQQKTELFERAIREQQKEIEELRNEIKNCVRTAESSVREK
ncbi:MAG: hypothetical protein PHY88_04450, partial [Candidatus Omnitrophica bacterium]|nr:hypothetical protein [Candidatus Omnitrophota bacterium]